MMNRQNNAAFIPPAAVREGAPPLYNKQGPARVPKDFVEAMKRVPAKAADKPNTREPEMAAEAPLARSKTAKSSACKWKSSFKPVGEEDDDNPEEQNACGSETVQLYDPYDPGTADSEIEAALQNQHLSNRDQDNHPERQRPSQGTQRCKKSRWDSSCAGPESQTFNRRDLDHENQLGASTHLSSGNGQPERQSFSPHNDSMDRLGYGSASTPLDHRVCIPEPAVHSSNAQEFAVSYGLQKTNREDEPEHHTERSTTVILSPPQSQHHFTHHSGPMEKGLDQIATATEVTGDRCKIVLMDKEPITCDLCEVELANGQELEEHLDSKGHWDTLEYIQQNSNYDDFAIAFLQEVMFYKCRQCSRAIEDSALPALQKNDHMTKVEMFHCAACSALVATSASSVQSHITSREHLSNTKGFRVQQRRTCLDRAETIMQELKPHFEHFLKGDRPFE